jgi:ABC-type sugar transport system substrate-binding protein
MPRKLAGQQLALSDDWADKVPEGVQEAADTYMSARIKKTNATERFNGAETSLIDLMISQKCHKVQVIYKDGTKVLELSELVKLKLRKPEKAPSADEDDEQ